MEKIRSTVSALLARCRGDCRACGRSAGRFPCVFCLDASDAGRGFVPVDSNQAVLDAVFRLGRYFATGAPSPLAEALLGFKYRGDRAAGHALRRLVTHAAGLPSSHGVVVPVPLHARRLRERGYNQAAWLARGAARSMRVPIDTRALVRVADTPPQAQAGADERRRMHDAFAGSARLEGRSVLLVDDVYTTGTTLAAAAFAAREAGAVRVDAAVLLLAGRE